MNFLTRFGFLIFTGLLFISPVHAQSSVKVMCDTTFDKFRTVRLPQPMPGAFYRFVVPEQGQPVHQVERITQAGTEVLDIPLPPELIGKVYVSKVSPDGQYMALIPAEHQAPFVVWKIDTTELTSVVLPDEDIDYLDTSTKSMTRQENMLTWSDDSHLLIQYFDLDYNRFDHLVAQKTLTVTDTPFQITAGNRIDIMYPRLTPPPESSFPTAVFSPQHTYVTLVSEDVYTRFQVYNTLTEELLADFQSGVTRFSDVTNDTLAVTYEPIWLPDESQFFMLHRLNPDSSPVRYNIAKIDVNNNFQLDDTLRETLEAVFGDAFTFDYRFTPTLNPAGTQFVAEIFVPDPRQYYLVIEQLDTGEITAICDGEDITTNSFPFWGLGDRYFGYWDNGRIVIYNLDTGAGYGENGIGFMNWTANPIETDTVELN